MSSHFPVTVIHAQSLLSIIYIELFVLMEMVDRTRVRKSISDPSPSFPFIYHFRHISTFFRLSIGLEILVNSTLSAVTIFVRFQFHASFYSAHGNARALNEPFFAELA